MTKTAETNLDSRLVVISGPSGVGKSTVIKALLERMPELVFSISATTRRPRTGEIDGQDYHFLTPQAFEQCVKENAFIEHAEVFGNRYGTPVDELRRATQSSRGLVLEIDVQGGIQVRAKHPNALLILLTTPSLEVARQRLIDRKTETPEAIEKRFAQARHELQTARRSEAYNAEVVNDAVDHAVRRIEELVKEHWRSHND